MTTRGVSFAGVLHGPYFRRRTAKQDFKLVKVFSDTGESMWVQEHEGEWYFYTRYFVAPYRRAEPMLTHYNLNQREAAGFAVSETGGLCRVPSAMPPPIGTVLDGKHTLEAELYRRTRTPVVLPLPGSPSLLLKVEGKDFGLDVRWLAFLCGAYGEDVNNLRFRCREASGPFTAPHLAPVQVTDPDLNFLGLVMTVRVET